MRVWISYDRPGRVGASNEQLHFDEPRKSNIRGFMSLNVKDMLFECHITLPLLTNEQRRYVEKTAEILHWKTSEIARDPVLGDATYFYLTTHTRDYTEMLVKLGTMRADLQVWEIPIIREKIEMIVHDTKEKK